MKFLTRIFPAIILAVFISATCFAASHREAPLIAFDPAADNTDVYFFVSYDEENLGPFPRGPQGNHDLKRFPWSGTG